MIPVRVLQWFRAASTEARIALGRSDWRRWRASDNLQEFWDERTVCIARMIPAGSSVLEFGAGRETLSRCLPEGCTYTPSDLIGRTTRTFIYSLNDRPLGRIPPHDVAVFSGVLEYIFDVAAVARHLHPSVSKVLASYAVTDVPEYSSRVRRRAEGWVNDLSRDELVEIFHIAGFQLMSASSWRNQVLFDFQRIPDGQAVP